MDQLTRPCSLGVQSEQKDYLPRKYTNWDRQKKYYLKRVLVDNVWCYSNEEAHVKLSPADTKQALFLAALAWSKSAEKIMFALLTK